MDKMDDKTLPMVSDLTTCESTQQMLEKARKDGVSTAWDRAVDMKPCPIGVESACCKMCHMGPCRLNAKKPYDKVGVCGATIDTIMARNFARMVAAETAAHSDHGLAILELFKDVASGKISDYTIKDPIKLEELCNSLGIETQGLDIQGMAQALYQELIKTYTQLDGELPFVKRAPEKDRKSTRLNSSHNSESRMPSSA
jgi:carbon-monoxide dehydrogenase catalytic subunit